MKTHPLLIVGGVAAAAIGVAELLKLRAQFQTVNRTASTVPPSPAVVVAPTAPARIPPDSSPSTSASEDSSEELFSDPIVSQAAQVASQNVISQSRAADAAAQAFPDSAGPAITPDDALGAIAKQASALFTSPEGAALNAGLGGLTSVLSDSSEG